MRRLPLPPCADVETSLTALERHLRLRWRTVPSQQGSLCLYALLEKAAKLAVQRRGDSGPPRNSTGGPEGSPGALKREDSLKALDGSAARAPSFSKQSRDGDAVQQQQQQADVDDPVPPHSLMNMLQLPHLAAPKVRRHI